LEIDERKTRPSPPLFPRKGDAELRLTRNRNGKFDQRNQEKAIPFVSDHSSMPPQVSFTKISCRQDKMSNASATVVFIKPFWLFISSLKQK
jgi:hypothetical protein